jgi:hypothetical protein
VPKQYKEVKESLFNKNAVKVICALGKKTSITTTHTKVNFMWILEKNPSLWETIFLTWNKP